MASQSLYSTAALQHGERSKANQLDQRQLGGRVKHAQTSATRAVGTAAAIVVSQLSHIACL